MPLIQRIPIGTDGQLEIRSRTIRHKPCIVLNTLVPDNLRGLRRSQEGIHLEHAIVPVVLKAIQEVLTKATVTKSNGRENWRR